MKKSFISYSCVIGVILWIWWLIPSQENPQTSRRGVDSALSGPALATQAKSVARNAEQPDPATAAEDTMAALLSGPILEWREIEPTVGVASPSRVEIYRTTFRYPLVRVEKNADGEIVSAAVADHLIVRRRSGVTHEEFVRFMAEAGLDIRKRLYRDCGYLVSGSSRTLDALEDLQNRLRPEAPDSPVEMAEPDDIATICSVPNDPHFSKLYGMNNSRDADIDAPEAWDTVTDASGIAVGVIDTGIDYNHPDLASNIWTNPGEIGGNGIDEDGNGLIDDTHGYDFYNDDANPMDDHSHGTHCAGTIGARGNNGVGVAGVTWSSRMMALKAFSSTGSGPSSAILEAINYASEMGARVTSNSYSSFSFSATRNAAIEAAGVAGCLFVTAAANEGRAIVAHGEEGFHRYVASANLDYVLSVAATDSYDKLASFSNYGPVVVDVAAPGEGIYSTVPGSQYGYMSGTSMATPHVAGACALLLAREPSLTPLLVKQQIMATVDLVPSLAGKTVTGGRINVRRMLQGLNQEPPVITSALAASASFGTPFTYAITATNSPAEYGAAGLPQGLKLNRDTGVISGIPAVTGSFSVELRASNLGGTGTAMLALAVALEPPVITSPAAATGAVYAAFSYQITATNGVQTYAATGLPPGLSLNLGTGLISGYPEAEGVFTVGLAATNALGTATRDLEITIGPASPPQFVGLTNASAVYAVPFSYPLVATNLPTRFGASGLPAGLSINGTTGLISGIPDETGTFIIGVEAENSAGITSGQFSLLVNLMNAPVLTTPASVSAPVNEPFSFQITATNLPQSFTAGGLPTGLSLGGGGVISGTPTGPGTVLVELSATNATGTGRAKLSLTILPPPPVVTSATSASVIATQPFSYQIAATGAPTSFAASGLPSGLRLEPGTGRVVGSVASPGVFQFIVSATNTGGTGSAQVTLQVLPQPPVITSALEVYLGMNSPFTYDITASNNPDVFSAANLPAGLTLNTATGRITGTVATTGTRTIAISATNAGGTGTADLELVVHNSETRITSFSPAEVLPGGEVTIAGIGFDGATEVYFSDRNSKLVPATRFQVLGDGEIRATVPYLTQNYDSDYSWIIVISPHGLGVVLPPSTVEVFSGYDFGGSGRRFGLVHAGGALVSGGGGGHSVVVEQGGSARFSGGGSHIFFVDGGGYLDLTGGSAGATIFRSPSAVILNGTEIESVPTGREVASVRATIVSQLLRVRQVPRITSALTAGGVVGTSFNYQITTNGASPETPAYALGGAPPPGLAFSPANGLLSGVPTTPGVYDLGFSATNSAGTTAFTVRVTITGDLVPVITSNPGAEGSAGVSFAYQITAANSPASFAAANLPYGLSVNTQTGLISGTPVTNGIYSATISATNAIGTGSRSITIFIGVSPLAVTAFNPPQLASGTELTLTGRGLSDVARVYFISRGGALVGDLGRTIASDTTMRAVVPSLGHVWYDKSPVVATSATHTSVTFPANAVRYTTSSGTGGGGGQIFIVGNGATVTLGGGGGHLIFVETGGTLITGGGGGGHVVFLAPGATLSGSATRVLRSPGSILLNQGSGVSTLLPPIGLSMLGNNTLLNVFDLPVITSGDKTGQVGTPLSYSTTTQGFNFGLSYAAQGLPPGLTISEETGVISGTPTTAGTFPVVLSAADENGPGTKTVTFTITPPVLPTLVGTGRIDGTTSSAWTTQLAVTNGPATFSASGLPPGVTLSTGGLFGGTPSQEGVWIANLTLSNANGSRPMKLILAVNRPAPRITGLPASTVAGATLVIQGTGLAHSSSVYFNDRSLGLGPVAPVQNATATTAALTTPAIQLIHEPGALVALVAEGGATVALPASMTQVQSGGSVSAGGSSYYRVRAGGTLSSSGAGSITAYAETGSFVVLSGGGGQTIYAENGATVDMRGSNGTVLAAPNATVLQSGSVTIVPVADLRASDVPGYLTLSPVPIITSAASVRGYRDVPFYFIVKAANSPTAFTATGLPSGLVINTATGAISGQPANGGTFVTNLTTTNAAGSYSATLTFTIGGPVDQWRDTQFSSLPQGSASALAADDADADHDSLVNLLEYAGKLDPNSPNAASDLCHGEVFGGEYRFSFRRLQGAGTGSVVDGYAIGSVRYLVEWSGDFVQWRSGPEHFEQIGTATPNGDGTETVKVRLKKTVAQQPRVHVRLSVTPLPAP